MEDDFVMTRAPKPPPAPHQPSVPHPPLPKATLLDKLLGTAPVHQLPSPPKKKRLRTEREVREGPMDRYLKKK